jgi:phage terminase Nu1 subunit (DNA packaging protein)
VVDKLIDPDVNDYDARLLLNQKTTALFLQISANAFQKWGIEPKEKRGREALYYWPDVQAARDQKRDEARDDLLFNQKTTAALLGITPRAFADWRIEPCERRGRDAYYHWPAVFAEYLKRRFPNVNPDDDGEYLDLNQERARLAKEQADKLEMENAIQRGEIAYLPDVAKQQGRVFQMIRTKALGLPTKCAPHANPENPNIARDIIEREVLELLGEVAAADLSEELDECGSDVRVAPVNSQATTKVNGHGVVRHKEAAKQRK